MRLLREKVGCFVLILMDQYDQQVQLSHPCEIVFDGTAVHFTG